MMKIDYESAEKIDEVRHQKMYTEEFNRDMDFVVIGDSYIGPFASKKAADKTVDYLTSIQPQPESDYDRGMCKAMQAIAKSCGKIFGADIGYEDLPELVESLVNPPKPKPPVRVDYVKVGELGWHVWQYLQAFDNENVDWFFKRTGDKYMPVSDWFNVAECIRSGIDLYRRVEKPVDWQSDVVDYIYGNYNPTNHDALSESLVTAISSGIDFKYLTQEEFLQMCRVALRANGEL